MRTLRGASALAAIGFLVAMVLTGALPQQRQRVQFVAKGVMQLAPERVARVELIRGADRAVFLRGPGSGWIREGAGVLATPLAEKLSLAVQFMHTAGPVRVMEPDEFRGTDLREFGLDRPVLSIALHAESARALRAQFGGPNPNEMLQYMVVDGRGELFLMSRFVGQEWLAVAESVFAPPMSPKRALGRVGAIGAPLVVSVLCSLAVHAHEGAATAFAHVIISGQTVRYSLTLADASRVSLFPSGPARPPAEAFDLLAKAVSAKVRLTNNTAACAPGAARVIPPATSSLSITVVVDFACRGDVRVLTIRDDLPDVLGADLHTLAKVEWPGGTGQFAFAAESRQARFDLGDGAPVTRGVGSFFGLGIEHILTGYDHLLFLLALVLGGGGSWSLIKIVTAFTGAHSITLAFAVLGIVSLPERFVEAAIALSIAYVAAENLMPKYAVTPRWVVSFLFGLVHGFGFSSVLRTLGLPTGNLFWALGAFNLGVEAGQAAIVLPLAALLLWLRGKPWEPKLVATVSAIVLTVGLALFVERVVFAGPAVAG